MKQCRTNLAAVLATLLFTASSAIPLHLSAQPAPPVDEPAPRNAQGQLYISNPPGAPPGLWVTDYSSSATSSLGFGGGFFDVENIAFKPWARGLFDARQAHDLEPHARCKASGAIRQFLTPYGVEILDMPQIQQLYIFDVGGPHTWREVYMDGRSHPADLVPTNYGHSIGWWQGDTLVIDSTGYNTDFWFERMGLPHTEAVHITEYLTRRSKNRMDYRFVMTDEMAYDEPVEGRLSLRWDEGLELFEYICQDSNYAEELMVNQDMESIGKSSLIVP